jgi:hypothetical protein
VPTPSSETPTTRSPLSFQPLSLSPTAPLVAQPHSLSLSLASRRFVSRLPAAALSPARWLPKLSLSLAAALSSTLRPQLPACCRFPASPPFSALCSLSQQFVGRVVRGFDNKHQAFTGELN